MWVKIGVCIFFFFNDTATTEIYTLSLHDALPISGEVRRVHGDCMCSIGAVSNPDQQNINLGKAGRARSEEHTSELQSPVPISYAVFCLKKKKKTQI